MRVNNPIISILDYVTNYLNDLVYSLDKTIDELDYLEKRIENIQKKMKVRFVFRLQFLSYSVVFV